MTSSSAASAPVRAAMCPGMRLCRPTRSRGSCTGFVGTWLGHMVATIRGWVGWRKLMLSAAGGVGCRLRLVAFGFTTSRVIGCARQVTRTVTWMRWLQSGAGPLLRWALWQPRLSGPVAWGLACGLLAGRRYLWFWLLCLDVMTLSLRAWMRGL